ncbi:MAG TPA: hypothetical protein ENI95_09545 [Chloroflexi bacterium]|nr:hypothetical protein [Chloroflexota bacterium]
MSPVKRVERLLARKDVRGLCRALRSRDVLVRRRAAQALGELGNPAGVPCLTRALKDGDQYVVRWAVDSLRAIGDRSAVEALILAMFGSGRQLARLAAQALSGMNDPGAQQAVRLRDILLRNDWEALRRMGEEGGHALSLVLRSEQYRAWPSAKCRHVLEAALRLGVTPPPQHRRELSAMGVFVSGVHTVGDLLKGLGHRSPEVRIAAAEKLAESGQKWVTGPLYRRFRREVSAGGEQKVAIAFARALDRLGDDRAIACYRELLHHPESQRVAGAARALAGIGTPSAIKTLFWFAAQPPPPPAYRNVPVVLSALESAGPAAFEALRDLAGHESAQVRRLLIEVILRSGHPEAARLLARMARDEDDPDVQRTALDGLATLNTAQAADLLFELAEDVPRGWVIRSLAAITHPVGVRHLRTLAPDATTLEGIVREGDGRPLAGGLIQVVREQFFGEEAGWGWQAISARAETDSEGAFALTVLAGDPEAALRLKLVIPARQSGEESEVFTAPLELAAGQENRVEVRIDRFFSRLLLSVEARGGR